MKIDFELKHEGVIKFIIICALALVIILLITGTAFMFIYSVKNVNKDSKTTPIRIQKVVEKETIIINNTPTIIIGTKQMICLNRPNETKVTCYKQ